MNFTRIELAHYLGCDRKTRYNKLQKLEVTLPKGFLTLEQIHQVCEKMGHPKPIAGQKRLEAPPKTNGFPNFAHNSPTFPTFI